MIDENETRLVKRIPAMLLLASVALLAGCDDNRFAVLEPSAFAHHVEHFNTMEPENVVNLIPNAESWDWMKKEIPFFTCPDEDLEEIYYFRWWALRKHLKEVG